MSAHYYSTLSKATVFSNPNRYGWNLILKYHQLSATELLTFKQHLEIVDVVKYQDAATFSFLKTHFADEIDQCWNLTWEEVEFYCMNRKSSNGNPGSE